MRLRSTIIPRTIPLVMFFTIHVFCDTCRPIPFEDVRDASTAVYSISRDNLYVGGIVPGTLFTINKIIQASFLGQSLKAFVANRGDVTLICFQGTRTMMQFLHQVKSAIIMDSITIGGRKMKVMAYFFKALQLLRPRELVETSTNSTSRFIITGHSLGGALASLFSLYMKDHLKWDNPLTSLITFGQPRVGDGNYANVHDSFISPNQKLRLVYRYDIIPHLPCSDHTRYRHHSREVWIYKRHVKKISWKELIWRWETYVYFCSEGEAENCSNDVNKTNVLNAVKKVMHHASKYYRNTFKKMPHRVYDVSRIQRKSFEDAQCRLQK